MEKFYDQENDDFLKRGGILLRHNINSQGEFLVEKLSIDQDWDTQFFCESPEICIKIIDKLVLDHPDRFQTIKMHSEQCAVLNQ